MEPTPLLNEKEIFTRIAEGDESAFSVCYLHYGPLLTPFLVRLLGERHSAVEVVQVIVIMLGAIFSRVVVGASPFIPTTLA